MFRTTSGVNRSAHQMNIKLPQYPLPPELESVLDVTQGPILPEESRKSVMYSNVLVALHAAKRVDLSECHYIQLLKLALYLEEYQSNKEMKAKKLINQQIQKLPVKDPHEILFSILVEALDEERAWIREGDFVDLTDTGTYVAYTLRVTKVTQKHIVGSDDSSKLANVFAPNKLYNVSFRFQNYPLRCSHYALWLIFQENVITYLFPHKSKPFINTGTVRYGALTMLNPNIETNPEQKQAVLNIVNKSAFPAPYILYGPPGTGKTATLVEAISQIHKASSSNRILVCTPSNTAADEVAKRLLKFVEPSYMYRIYSQSRDKSSVDKELRNCSFYGGEKKLPLRREDINGKAILISTLCTSMRFALMELSHDYFSHIIIDEAGQGHEADILIPISVASKDGKLHSQIVLAGDPQQLGPTIISKLADIILGRSILERLMSYDTYQKDCYNNYNPKYITKLLHNYRSRSSIIHVSNKLFYNNELIAKYSSDEHKADFPVIFHGVDGVEEQYSYSPSTFNYEEIRVVLRYVYDLIDNRTSFGEVSAKDIGIVTPFKLQSKRIKKILQKKDAEEKSKLRSQLGKYIKVLKKNDESDTDSEDSNDEKDVVESENEKDDFEIGTTEEDKAKLRKQSGNDVNSEVDSHGNLMKYRNLKKINVGTVELFQGQERKIMIMTAVRSKTFVCGGRENIGYFVSNPKRFNVAMTRAQNALIVVGNPGILQKDHMWQYLIRYCMENRSYRGFRFTLRPPSNENPDSQGLQNVPSTASLFKEQPFKLFPLDVRDSASSDISKTVDLIVGPGKDSDADVLKDLIQQLQLQQLQQLQQLRSTLF